MIQVAKPYLDEEELKNIGEVLKTGWLGMGDRVFKFENELKGMFKRKHAICVNTGTTAIHIALDSLGIGPGDEVIVPSFTFVASAQAILMCDAKPVFCDIEPEDLNIDVSHLKKLLTKKTKAVIPVHYGGAPCRMDDILKIAKEKKLHVVEDAAHAFGSKYQDKLIGSFGDVTCFSFDPIKNITCGEGGAVLLDDDKTADIIMKKRILGIDKDTWNRYKHQRSWFYEVHMKGYRYHMSNINAAVGLVQLKKFDMLSNKRKEIAKLYDEELSKVKGISLLRHDYEKIVPFNYTILADKRDDLMRFLEAKGVGTVINYIPCHVHPLFNKEKISLPNTDAAYKRIVSIPLHAGLTVDEVKTVIKSIKDFYTEKA